ncbi:MAG: hypothetical protein LC715_00105 [Gammaproteobacteria bacterium]|nr:hypothetical protein [Gammaproteobacteria bacterium]
MNMSTGLLFLGGHITNPQLACALTSAASSEHETGRKAHADAAGVIATNPPTRDNRSAWLSQSIGDNVMNLFKSLMYLGGLESINPRIEDPDDEFGPTYGNRVASRRAFGLPDHGRAQSPPGIESRDQICVAGGCG